MIDAYEYLKSSTSLFTIMVLVFSTIFLISLLGAIKAIPLLLPAGIQNKQNDIDEIADKIFVKNKKSE